MEHVFRFFFGNGRRTVGTLVCVAILFGLMNVNLLIDAVKQAINEVGVPLVGIVVVLYAIKTIFGIKTK